MTFKDYLQMHASLQTETAVSLSLSFLQQISHCGFKRGGWKRSPGCPAQLAGSKNWVPGCHGGTSGCFAPFFIQN